MSSRVDKSMKNVSYGAVIQVINTLLSFVARIYLVRILGKEINGLNGLFTEVITMLSLAEMGIGAVITYSLYKPLAQKDEAKLTQLMWLFKIAYRIIAVVIIVAGAALTPFITYLVKEINYDSAYIRVIFFLFVLKTATTYLMSYKTSLLMADQKNYIVSAITIVCRAVMTILGIVVLYVTHSYVAYLILMIGFNFVTNFSVSYYAQKLYPFLKNSDKLPRNECMQILSNIRHVFIGRVSGRITNSTDNILISVLVNTVTSGIYSNYALIMSSVKQMFDQIIFSVTGSLGNLLVCETPAHCDRVLKRLTFIFFVAGFVFAGGFYCASAPFIILCFGKTYLMEKLVLFVCAINLYLSLWTKPLWGVMSVSGLFSDDKKTSIAGSVMNLTISFVLGKWIGMAGIFIGTTSTLLIQLIMKSYYLYKKAFGISSRSFIINSFKMTALVMAVIFAEKELCDLIKLSSPILSFGVHGLVSVMITSVVIIVVFGRSDEYKYFIVFLKEKIGARIFKKSEL